MMTRSSTTKRGFTLIELMVALSAGLIISAAAFMMARNATRFFQHEAGITSAQYAAMVGFNRLQADLRNASFLSSPNLNFERTNGKFCIQAATVLPPGAGTNPGMDRMAGVTVQADGSFDDGNGTLQALWTLNNMEPDSIIIAGSFDSTEQFVAAAIDDVGGGAYDVVLNRGQDGATIRAWLSEQRGGPTLAQIFRPGRILRVRDAEGHYALGVIQTFTDMDPEYHIVLANNPAMTKYETSDPSNKCGCAATCAGSPVNVISRMRYSLASLAAIPGLASYNNLNTSADHANVAAYHRGGPAPVTRTELIREELQVNGNPMVDGGGDRDTVQVFAEYVVDLEFGWTLEDVNTTAVPPVNIRIPVGTAAGAEYDAIDPTLGGRPDLVRSLQIRMSTRAHRRDREVGLNLTNAGTPIRFNLGNNRGFARMRTITADVFLPNQTRRLLP